MDAGLWPVARGDDRSRERTVGHLACSPRAGGDAAPERDAVRSSRHQNDACFMHRAEIGGGSCLFCFLPCPEHSLKLCLSILLCQSAAIETKHAELGKTPFMRPKPRMWRLLFLLIWSAGGILYVFFDVFLNRCLVKLEHLDGLGSSMLQVINCARCAM